MSRSKDVVHEELKKPNQNAQQTQKQNTSILETSGILDAYEYFLRQLCKNGLPSGNVYEFAAQQILKFERKRNTEIKKRVALKNSLEALETQQTQQDQVRENKANKSPEKKNQQKEEGKKGQQEPVAQDKQAQKQNIKQDIMDSKSPQAAQQQHDKKGQEAKQDNTTTSKKDNKKK